MEDHLNNPFKYIFSIWLCFTFYFVKIQLFFIFFFKGQHLRMIGSRIEIFCVEGKCHKQESVQASSFGKSYNREVELQWVSRHEHFAHLCGILRDIRTQHNMKYGIRLQSCVPASWCASFLFYLQESVFWGFSVNDGERLAAI